MLIPSSRFDLIVVSMMVATAMIMTTRPSLAFSSSQLCSTASPARRSITVEESCSSCYHERTSSLDRRRKIRENLLLFNSKKDSSSSSNSLAISYNDNALFNFHQRTQQEKISGYVGSSTFVNTDQLWNLAWHDSFVRNDLSDFVPPLTDNLQVLTLGESGSDGDMMDELNASNEGVKEDNDASIPAAALEEGDLPSTQTKTTSGTTTTEDTPVINSSASSSPNNNNNNNVFAYLGSILGNVNKNTIEIDTSTTASSSQEGAIELKSYDCILDKGLMAQLLTIPNNEESCTQLLLEATKRIREHGIYILQSQPLDDVTKKYLTNIGDLLGLQWQWDLDGISDENLSVSVARKYFVGELPTMGKLAKANYK